MSGRVGHRKRLICIKPANLRNNHITLTGHHDFFPADCFGSSAKSGKRGTLLKLEVEGLDDFIHTDIPTDKKSGRPRAMFRNREWVRKFFAKHKLAAGDTVAIERITDHHFRISPFESKTERANSDPFVFGELAGDGPTVIELFAGCGGMALGFKQAGFRTVLANEWDRDGCDTIRANVTDRVLHCAIQDIKEFPEADVVAGGPPCQGFSNLGERVPNDPRNQLWRQYFRCVEQVRPKIFVVENVPPLLKSAEYQEMKRLAEEMGYTVEGRVLNAADYGVPQTRKRAIIIGSRIGDPVFPAPTHADPKKAPLLAGHTLKKWVTVQDAIGHLPLEPTDKDWHIGRNPTQMSLERYRCIPAGGNRWDLPPHLMPDCWKRKTEGGTDLFGRLWWDRPSVTIRTEFYKPEKGRYLHPVAHRPITHLEAALLQSFPSTYKWCGRRIAVGVQIGNAVPPLLARAIAKAVTAAIEGQSRERKAEGD